MKGTVLVVDDNEGVRELVGDILEDEGFAVVKAHNGQVGLDVLAERADIDLVLLDVWMPILDGEEFLRVYAGDVPIIVMSASVDAAELAGRTQAVGHFTKPFDIDKMLGTVHKHIRHAS